MFDYIWGYKPDKISRDIVTMNYRDGDVKMINLKSYIMSSQVSWIRRLFKNTSYNWISIFENTISSVEKICIFGAFWIIKLATFTTNPFWEDVLNSWEMVIKKQKNQNQFWNSNFPIMVQPYDNRSSTSFPRMEESKNSIC